MSKQTVILLAVAGIAVIVAATWNSSPAQPAQPPTLWQNAMTAVSQVESAVNPFNWIPPWVIVLLFVVAIGILFVIWKDSPAIARALRG